MKQDDPHQAAGENEPHEEAGPKAPEARPPVDRSRLPREEPRTGLPTTQPGTGFKFRKKHAIPFAVVVVVLIVVVIAKNPGGSEKTSVVNQPPSPAVIVSLAGTGSGAVSGSGIACPSTCTMTYSSETSVSLTASPASGSTFRGWGGDCSGTEPCNLVVGSPIKVTATFMKNPGHTEPAYRPTELTFERSTTYNINHLPITHGGSLGEPEQDGFSMNTYSAGHGYVTHFEVAGSSGSKVASWTGQGEPTITDCKQALEASGLRELSIPHQGEWFCAETDKHYIALIRYDGSQGEYYETFKIFAKVYRPGA
jgi:hypothetical protein